MNGMIQYLSSLPEISNLIVLGGKSFNMWMAEEIIREIRVDCISFYIQDRMFERKCKKLILQMSESDRRIDPMRFEFHKYEDAFCLDPLPQRTALLFDNVEDSKQLFQLNKLRPYCLCGALVRGSFGAYEVWENYRKCSDKIYLVTWGADKSDEILNWTCRKSCDTELSVIYPMYNVAQYLDKCIATTTAWKADYVEFLFVDDGSPDNSAEIVKEAAKKDSRIKLLRKENGGCASARQYGLERAKGRYVGFIDPDDYIDEVMFHKLMRRAMTGTYDVAYCGYTEEYTETGGMSQIADMLWEPYCSGTSNHDDIINLCGFCRVAIWRGIYSLEMIRKAKLHFYTDLRRFDDLPFKFEVFSVARSVVAIPEHLYYYRVGRPGQDVSSNDERLYVHFPLFNHLDEYVSIKGTNELVEMLQVVKLKTHSYAIKKILPEYLNEYLKQAHADLLSLYTPKECRMIYKRFLGKRDRLLFSAIIHENASLAKKLAV